MSSAGPASSHLCPSLRLCPPPGTPSPAPEALTSAAFPALGRGLSRWRTPGCLCWALSLMSDARLPRHTATADWVSRVSNMGGRLSFSPCSPCRAQHTTFHRLDRVGRGPCVGPPPLPGCLVRGALSALHPQGPGRCGFRSAPGFPVLQWEVLLTGCLQGGPLSVAPLQHHTRAPVLLTPMAPLELLGQMKWEPQVAGKWVPLCSNSGVHIPHLLCLHDPLQTTGAK